jgi:hypothetical protein
MHRTGRSNQGAYAPEDVVRKFAQLIQRKHLWQASDQRHAPVEVVDTVEVSNAQAPEQRIDTHDGVNSVEASNAQLLQADLLSESDVSAQLSILLHRPVQFRLRITPDKELALIDVAMLFTGLDNNQAGLAVRRLLEQFPDVRSNRLNFKFPGRGQKTVDVAPLAEALEFAFLLPGRAASKVRKEAAKLLVRYIGGDLSLIDEVCQLNRVQVALAKIPEDERTAEQQTARIFGETVENTTTTQLTIASSSSIFCLPPPPIIMASCTAGCLDDGPPHFYILCIPGQPGSQDGEEGDIYRGGRTKDFDARLPEHRKTYGEGVHMALCAPNYGHVEKLWHRHIRPNAITQEPREERILASKMEIGLAPGFIMELHSRRQTELQLENISQTSRKRTREDAEEDLVIAEIDAKRDLANAKRDLAVAELGAKLEFARDREEIARDREKLMRRLAADGNAEALKVLLAPTN